jgi:hypothetical protein
LNFFYVWYLELTSTYKFYHEKTLPWPQFGSTFWTNDYQGERLVTKQQFSLMNGSIWLLLSWILYTNLTTQNAVVKLDNSNVLPLIALLMSILDVITSPHRISRCAMFSANHSSGAPEVKQTIKILQLSLSILIHDYKAMT